MSHMGLVKSAVKKFSGHTSVDVLPGKRLAGSYQRVVTSEDLEQAGMLGQVKALEAFDETRCDEIKWATFATWYIEGYIRRSLKDFSEGALRVPLGKVEEAFRLRDEGDELAARALLYKLRRIRQPARLDHPVRAGHDKITPLKDILPGRNGCKEQSEGEDWRRWVAQLVRETGGDRPFRMPPRSIPERVAFLVWENDGPLTLDDLVDAAEAAGWCQSAQPYSCKKIRTSLGTARQRGWVKKAASTGGPVRYERAGDPRPGEAGARDVDILMRFLGLDNPDGNREQMAALGREYGISRAGAWEVVRKGMAKLKAAMEAA